MTTGFDLSERIIQKFANIFKVQLKTPVICLWFIRVRQEKNNNMRGYHFQSTIVPGIL